MYFDPRPKRRREDLYDREKEIDEFKKSLKTAPLTIVTGIRRLGKTSLILVGLSDKPSVVVDLRGVPQSREGLYRRIESAMNEFFKKHKNLWQRFRKELKNITGVHVFGAGISLSWGEKRVDLVELLKSLKNYEVVLAFDEVQYLRGPIGKEFAEVLAYLYDHSDLKLVLSGSEIGLLYDFLGVENPKAPLYGRYFREVRLERFDQFKSRDFLVKGFKQVGLQVEDEVINYACERLNGIVGWLVHFGLKCLEKKPSMRVVEEVLDEASKLSLEEFTTFLKKHTPAERRLFEIARAIAMGRKTWSEIKEHLESTEQRTISSGTLSRSIRTLLKASFVEKIIEGRNIYYKLADPVLSYALLKQTSQEGAFLK